MAALGSINYRQGSSIVHRLDPRIKLTAMVLFSLACLQAAGTGLLLLTGVVLLGLSVATVPLGSWLRELRWIGVLLLLLILTRALFTPGTPFLPLFPTPLRLSLAGALEGAVMAWRLMNIVLLGLLLSTTTSAKEIAAALAGLLKWVPFVNGQRLGTMIGLMLRFIPEILRQAEQTGDALRARGIESRRSPVRRMACTAIPLLRRVARTGDRLAVAMEARGYSDDRTPPAFRTSPKDWVGLILLVAVFVTAVLI